MSRNLIVVVLALSVYGCGPPLVWGGDEATKRRLLEIVPIGSTVDDLEAEADAREWRISNRDDRAFPKGEPHYLADRCEHEGGVSRKIIVAEYGVLTTSVETAWMFDVNGKLSSLCMRRTTDAL